MTSARHVAAERRGRHAEFLARWRLRLAGWRIVAAGLRLPAGQVDIVARRGRILAFVEVKARSSAEDAAESLHPAQRLRIARAAEQFVAMRPQFAAFEVRFDMVLVAPGSWPRHLQDAWRDSR
ncbi:MAG: YraN family protein [Alphaproteobacteria bacterium]|nr:YraN family protein [Alphaproteobacteria bacterium]